MDDLRPVRLATWPTPLEPAPRLAAAIGLDPDDLWIKRDDLAGLGGGGNKVRKLEWTCAAALADGADTLVTSGAPQSNHARLTAAAGARLGLDVTLVLDGRPPAGPTGNLLLDALFGAAVRWGTDVAAVAASLAEAGRRPYVIPFGGSSVLAARGYEEAGRELLAQAPDVATVVVALGSGGTAAGLITALGTARVLAVHTGAVPDPRRSLAELAVPPEGLRLRLDQVGAGYAQLTDDVRAALLLAARCEGLALDPVYTGRALAGLVAAVRDGQIRRGERTVLLHSGGLPGLFGHAAATDWLAQAAGTSSTR